MRSESPEYLENQGEVLYFAGLHHTTREVDLQDICSKYGVVTSATIIYDPRTSESRGFGFVTMANGREADEVINQLNGRELDGKPLTIQKARRKAPRKATPGRYLGKLNNRKNLIRARFVASRERTFHDYTPYDRSPPRYRRGSPRYSREEHSPRQYRRSPPPRGFRRDRSPDYRR
uniref:RRM domain-containing protein n=1 Tax=Arcella intermedia TaxID=1963864 RepID=A0A6B2LIR3_9EUKA